MAPASSPTGCVLFDFDGVIADTERVHLAAYNHTLATHAADIGGPLEIAAEDYFRKYIVFGDREGFWHMLRDAGRPHDADLIKKLMDAKHHIFQDKLEEFAEPLPGVHEVIAWLETHNIPRAICSGARRAEIETLLTAFNLRHHFDIIVTIEDVRCGKPDPEGYNQAFDRLNIKHDGNLLREHSLVIEDSAGGCSAGKAANLRVLGVATSLPLRDLKNCATFAVESLAGIEPQLAEWLAVK